MVNQKKFLMNEMPWDKLKEIGMTEEAFLDLPKDSIDRIMTGNLSPLMKMKFLDTNGNTIKLPESMKLSQSEDGVVPAKFRLQREANGKVSLVLHPKKNEIDLMIGETVITEQQLKQLKEQESVRTLIRKYGKDEMCYVQLDSDLNVLHMTSEKNITIPNAIGDVTIGQEIEQRLREGKPVELDVGDTKVTVGVDLNARNGFRVVEGDMDEWKQRKLEQWDRITPGIKGYWKTSENGWEYELHHQQDRKMTTEQTVEKETGRVLNTQQELEMQMSRSRGMRR